MMLAISSSNGTFCASLGGAHIFLLYLGDGPRPHRYIYHSQSTFASILSRKVLRGAPETEIQQTWKMLSQVFSR
jgi:hypothetical protein